ncbi:MAG: galactokinase family protein [Eubacteriales bacterium]|nr:galactokinase family protein [Eubacteriales bacterium]
MKNINTVIQEVKDGVYTDWLKEIYVDESKIEYQQNRYHYALINFKSLYGDKEIEIYSAAGRSEVGGNHTDHQHGKVIATSLNLDAIGVVAKREDQLVKIKSEGYKPFTVDLSDLSLVDEEVGTSLALTKGVAKKIVDNGYKIGGFDAYITSDVLNGAGMSSSAAFEVLLGNIFSGLFNDGNLDQVLIAQISQYAENVYFGKPCGLMDQMACAYGGLINIDFKDPSNPIVHPVKVDFEHYKHSLCIVDTKGSHADLTDEYAAIPVELKKVCDFFGKEFLRDVKEEDFYANLPAVREAAGDRAVLRAIHVFEENKRVDAQMEALERGDFEGFKALIKASGNSSYKFLQNIYANKDYNNQSVSIGLAISEVILKDRGVCRVHGGGFAGTIQAFVPDDMVVEYKKGIEAVFGEGSCHILKVRKYGGMKVL